MDEQKTDEKTESEDSDTDNDDGVQQEEPALVKQANEAAEKLKAENDRKEALIRREEELAARNALGGTTDSNEGTIPTEESPKDYVNRVLSGGINPTPKEE